MAINQLNKDKVFPVCRWPGGANVRAVSFNFHTPLPDTRELALTREEKAAVCQQLEGLMREGYPIFNLRSAFPYLIENTFPTPAASVW